MVLATGQLVNIRSDVNGPDAQGNSTFLPGKPKGQRAGTFFGI
jgi:hypothetical protein